MRVDGWFLAGIGIFFAIIGVVYWAASYEDAGFLMLMGSALLGLLLKTLPRLHGSFQRLRAVHHTA